MTEQPSTLTETVLEEHLTEGSLDPGTDVDIHMDQVLLQDVLGPLVWMEFEALGFETVRTDLVVTYADHQVYEELSEGDNLAVVEDMAAGVEAGREAFTIRVNDGWSFEVHLDASERERSVLAAGGLLPYISAQHGDDK